MSITAYTIARIGNVSQVHVTSDLVSQVIYYHWYVDGEWQGCTTAPTRGFYTMDGEQSRVTVLDTDDHDYDYIANAPQGYPSRRTVWWVRSLGDVDRYRIEQSANGGVWSTVATVPAVTWGWSYHFVTDRLADLTHYAWRIVPVDACGRDGTPLELDEERVVRIPDAPSFGVSFSVGDGTVSFSSA